MDKYLGLSHLSKAVKALLRKISQVGDSKVDKSSVSAELSEGVKVAEVGGVDIYAPNGGASTWNEIQGKPEFAAVATSGDYSDLNNTPSLASVATSGSYNDLNNKPTIPAAQVNSDWSSSSGVSQILNKPTIPQEGTVTPILTSGVAIAVIDGVTIYAPDPNAT